MHPQEGSTASLLLGKFNNLQSYYNVHYSHYILLPYTHALDHLFRVTLYVLCKFHGSLDIISFGFASLDIAPYIHIQAYTYPCIFFIAPGYFIPINETMQ